MAIRFLRLNSTLGALLVGLLMTPFLAGCMDIGSRTLLNLGYSEIASSPPKYDDADANADEFLRAHPSGIGAAEAWYLKGRVEEARAMDPALSPLLADKVKCLDRARDDYEEGLRMGPPIDARALLRSGIANVDFFEEDYVGALREWQASYENLAKDDQKAWVLYQIGRCQQRLGMFKDADTTFRDVQKFYPASPASARAATRIGMNAFYVEVVEFSDLNSAEQTAGKLRAEHYTASRAIDAGRQMVRVGPLATFVDAKAVQSRLSKEFPTAVISP